MNIQKLLAILLTSLICFSATFAAEINVNTTNDEITDDANCSLREAVIAANTNTSVHGCTAGEEAPVVDIINVPAGTYSLSLDCDFANDDLGADFVPDAYCGELEIHEDVVVRGVGQGVTIIDAPGEPEDRDNVGISIDNPHRIFNVDAGPIDFDDEGLDVSNGTSCSDDCEVGISATFEDLTLEDGYASSGGAIYAAPSSPCSYPEVILRRVEARNNFANYDGGAVFVRGRLVVENSNLHDNQAGYFSYSYYNYVGFGGGIYLGNLYELQSCNIQSSISGSEIDDNMANYSGGGIYIASFNNVTVQDSFLDANGTMHQGAGIFNSSSNLTLQNTQVINGRGTPFAVMDQDDHEFSAPYVGGGIFNAQENFDFCFFRNAEDGETSHELRIENSVISNNNAYEGGAGIYNSLFDFRFRSGDVDCVAPVNGFSSPDTVVILNSEVNSNLAGYEGGAIVNDIFTGPFTISQSTIANNEAYMAAGIANYWTMDVSQSTISGNTAANFGLRQTNLNAEEDNELFYVRTNEGGAGVANNGSITLTNTTVSGNESFGSGAGIYNEVWSEYLYAYHGIVILEEEGSDLPEPGTHLRNVTVTDNTILETGDGFFPDSHNQSLFVSNGGGIATDGGAIKLRNTIVAGNVDLMDNYTYSDIARGEREPINPDDFADFAPDCWVGVVTDGEFCNLALSPCEELEPQIISEKYNLVGDNTGCSAFSPDNTDNDQVGTGDNPIDPLLGVLDDNGGPTLTHLPLKDSPVLDMGNPNTPVADGEILVAVDEEFACLAFDQRGTVRPQDGDNDGKATCDIGAVEAIVDCAGIPSGTTEFDACGICGGTAEVCQSVCDETNIFSDQVNLDGAAVALSEYGQRNLRRILRRLTGRRNAGANLADQLVVQFENVWSNTWGIPTVIRNNCTGGLNCISVSNVARVEAILAGLEEMFNINLKKFVNRQIKRALRKREGGLTNRRKRFLRRLRNTNTSLFEIAEEQANRIPAETTQCEK